MADLAAFLALARVEVHRYGDEDDVFLRELVQNARDAGARTISVSTGVSGGAATIIVDDDGEGMSCAAVSERLLRLFASGKDDDGDAAGCFGVGFWSVLRADPRRSSSTATTARAAAPSAST